MKELYISDLDGTLLNKSAELSPYTVQSLNKLIEKGLYFSVATARTAATVLKILKDVHVNTPISLMNGVSIYDVQNQRYIKTEYIEKASVHRMLRLLKQYGRTGFLYEIENDTMKTYYENLDSEHRKIFVEERVGKYNKVFTKVDSFMDCRDSNIVYLSICDKRESLEPLFEELRLDTQLYIEFYKDIYMDDHWYFEACSSKASKYNAAMYLRSVFGFDKVTAFGDNLNDLSLFRASDECYAVNNAKEEVKSKATAVIAGNEEDGVAKFLLNRFR
jgi:Cof subfamily protein (haloacid dehalogenase superfamily)